MDGVQEESGALLEEDEVRIFDVVVMTADMPDQHLTKGQVGTIVENLDANTVLVEFADQSGVCQVMAPVNLSMLMEQKDVQASVKGGTDA